MPQYNTNIGNVEGGYGGGYQGPPLRPQYPTTPGMNPTYGMPGYRWGGTEQEVGDLYRSQHGFNPQTGGLEGPIALPPAHLALNMQAEHDRAVWNARFRMGRDALGFAQGGNRLLQSYRPGGAAAMEAGTYGQMANIQMQRAQMHQPLDLLGDYRRDQIARAGRSGKKNRTIGTALQVVGAVASIIPGGQAVGMGLMAAGGAVASQGNAQGAASFARGQQGGQMRSGNLAAPGQPGGQGGYDPNTGAIGGPQPQQGPPRPPEMAPQPVGGPVGSQQPYNQEAGFIGPQPMEAGLQQGPGQGAGPDIPGGPPGGQQGPPRPGFEGMDAPPIQGVGSMIIPGQLEGGSVIGAINRSSMGMTSALETDVAMGEFLAETLEEDDFLRALPIAIDREFALRGMIPTGDPY